MLQHERLPEKQGGPSFFGKLLRKVDGCDLSFEFSEKSDANKITVDDLYNQVSESLYLYESTEPITGKVTLLPSSSGYRHNGVTIALLGIVKTVSEEEVKTEFLRQECRFDPDTLSGPTAFDFSFAAVKPYESYRGMNVTVAYYVRVSVGRPVKNITGKQEVWVTQVDTELSKTQPDASAHRSYFRETVFGPQSIAMDVGVDNRLHIEFRYDKGVFHLQERVLGKVTFKTADLDIQYGEVAVLRKEFLGPAGETNDFDMETLQKFEIMDGTPIVGEVVPIRLYLYSIPRLTPTYIGVADAFSVRYYLNLVLVTSSGKRYFKQQEITLYRRTGQERLTANFDLPAMRMNNAASPSSGKRE